MGDVRQPAGSPGSVPIAASHPDVPLARLFGIAYRHLVVSLHDRLAARGWRDLRPSYGYVLLACRDRPTTSTELADLLGMTKQAASKLIEGLVGAGLVRRRPSRDDSRVRLVTLTPRGRRLLGAVEEVYVELEQEWADVLGRPAVEALRVALVEVLTTAYEGKLPPVRPV